MQISDPNEIKLWIEIAQAIVTTLAILIGGLWSYTVFVAGRTTAPNMQIHLELKQVFDSNKAKRAIISVKFKNIGQTKVLREACYIGLKSVNDKQEILEPFAVLDGTPIDFDREEDVDIIPTVSLLYLR